MNITFNIPSLVPINILLCWASRRITETAIYGLVVSHLNGLFGDRVSPSKPHWPWLSYAIVYLSMLLSMVQGSPQLLSAGTMAA